MRPWCRSASTSACSSTACRYKSASRSALSRCLLRSGNGSMSGKANKAAVAVAEVSKTVNGALRVKLHDKHAALVLIGTHLGMLDDGGQMQERKQTSAD